MMKASATTNTPAPSSPYKSGKSMMKDLLTKAFFLELFATIIVKILVEMVPAYEIAINYVIVIISVFIIIIILLRKVIFNIYKELMLLAPTISRIVLISIVIFLIAPIIIGNYAGEKSAGYLFPPVYEITIPKPNSEVDQIITVGGHGAIPGADIKVFVIDNLGQKWPQGNTISDMTGNWNLYPVNIGRLNGEDIGKTYQIYALMTTQSGMNYSTNEVSVKRK